MENFLKANYLTCGHDRSQERNIIHLKFEISNKPYTFFETTKYSIFTTKGVFPEVQIKPAKFANNVIIWQNLNNPEICEKNFNSHGECITQQIIAEDSYRKPLMTCMIGKLEIPKKLQLINLICIFNVREVIVPTPPIQYTFQIQVLWQRK